MAVVSGGPPPAPRSYTTPWDSTQGDGRSGGSERALRLGPAGAGSWPVGGFDYTTECPSPPGSRRLPAQQAGPVSASSGILPGPVGEHQPEWRQRRETGSDVTGKHTETMPAGSDDRSAAAVFSTPSRLATRPIACWTQRSPRPIRCRQGGRPSMGARVADLRVPAADDRLGDRPGGRVRAPGPNGSQRHHRGGHLRVAATALRSGIPDGRPLRCSGTRTTTAGGGTGSQNGTYEAPSGAEPRWSIRGGRPGSDGCLRASRTRLFRATRRVGP